MSKKYPKQYEYVCRQFAGGSCANSEETIEALNKLGNDGWILIGSLHEQGSAFGEGMKWNPMWFGLFMREKQQSKE
jgi:hypothetical protein